ISLYQGPYNMFRPAVPSIDTPGVAGFCVTAAVLNQANLLGFDPEVLTPGTSSARSVVLLPSWLASAPSRIVNGNPLWILMIGENDHPLRSWRPRKWSPW